jgi:lysophospholipase L1-like esterase
MSYGPSPFEPELVTFEQHPAPHHANVFYGSSSIRLWEDIDRWFPGLSVVNRGFGGTTLAECLYLIPRVILPLEPSSLVLYAGDNDLDQGASPEQVLHLFKQFIERIHKHFPGLPVAYVAVKPSPARYWNLTTIRRSNEMIRESIPQLPLVDYLDVFTPMLSPAGGSRPELFTEDGLHMNTDGYTLWTGVIWAWLDKLPPP